MDKEDKLAVIVNNPKEVQIQMDLEVNPSSNFVICTYWWGSGNQNNNIARPCISFYEKIIKDITKFLISVIKEIPSKKIRGVDLLKLDNVKKYIKSISNTYLNMIYSQFDVNNDFDAIQKITKSRKPSSYIYKQLNEVQFIFFIITDYIVKIILDDIEKLIEIDLSLIHI